MHNINGKFSQAPKVRTSVLAHMKKHPGLKRPPLYPGAARQRRQIAKDKLLVEIEALSADVARLPNGDQQERLNDRIDELMTEHEAEG